MKRITDFIKKHKIKTSGGGSAAAVLNASFGGDADRMIDYLNDYADNNSINNKQLSSIVRGRITSPAELAADKIIYELCKTIDYIVQVELGSKVPYRQEIEVPHPWQIRLNSVLKHFAVNKRGRAYSKYNDIKTRLISMFTNYSWVDLPAKIYDRININEYVSVVLNNYLWDKENWKKDLNDVLDNVNVEIIAEYNKPAPDFSGVVAKFKGVK